MTYKAQIVKPKYRKLEGSDNLLAVDVNGYQVLTNKECNQEELKVFFPSGGKLNQTLLSRTNSFRQKYGLNEDAQAAGFFEDDCRIKTIRMRGAKSEGYMIPLSSLELLSVDTKKYKLDDLLDVLKDRDGNEVELCCKYIPPYWLTKDGKVKSLSPLHLSPKLVPSFEKHYETGQLRQNTRKIPDGARLWTSVKAHGTSARTGNIPYNAPPTKWERLKAWLFNLLPLTFLAPEVVYKIVTGTRNTILKIGFEAEDKFEWYRVWAHNLLAPYLIENMTIYYEIVGYNVKVKDQKDPAPLFTHSIPKEEKELRKKYGERVEYLYGCTPENPNKILIYRIVTGNYEWSPAEILHFVRSINDPNIFSANFTTLIESFSQTEEGIQDLTSKVEEYIKKHNDDYNHPTEGVCIRVEHPNIPPEMSTLKWKSFTFSLLEDIAYSNPNYQDMEVV